MVYIQEAHPTDLWHMPSNLRDGVLYSSARTGSERNQTASACVRKLGIRIPALRDGIANRTERAYTGWPDRLYVVDRTGRVAYKSKAGPFGFHPEEMAKVLQSVVSSSNK